MLSAPPAASSEGDSSRSPLDAVPGVANNQKEAGNPTEGRISLWSTFTEESILQTAQVCLSGGILLFSLHDDGSASWLWELGAKSIDQSTEVCSSEIGAGRGGQDCVFIVGGMISLDFSHAGGNESDTFEI